MRTLWALGSHSGRTGGGGTSEGMFAAIPILQQGAADTGQWRIADSSRLDKAMIGPHRGRRSYIMHSSSLVSPVAEMTRVLSGGYRFRVSDFHEVFLYSVQIALGPNRLPRH